MSFEVWIEPEKRAPKATRLMNYHFQELNCESDVKQYQWPEMVNHSKTLVKHVISL